MYDTCIFANIIPIININKTMQTNDNNLTSKKKIVPLHFCLLHEKDSIKKLFAAYWVLGLNLLVDSAFCRVHSMHSFLMSV